ncbi:MAG: hypothetical protein JEZ09_08270 [Salinivirgaceae bacterium]|nr:hypothetical protein [Salinivirgaceae bacterium]
MKASKIFTLLLMLFTMLTSYAQEEEKKEEFKPNGKATGTVFFNYHYDLTEGVEKKSQFELLRSYFGYTYNFSEKFTTKVLFDVGYEEKVTDALTNKKTNSFTAFLKIASLEYKINKMLTIEGGMIATHIGDVQEKFWGYRYILATQQIRDKFNSSADLGVKGTFKPIDMLEFHLGVYNGEGYKSIQDNFGSQRVTADVVIRPIEGLIFKTYYDIKPKRDTSALVTDSLKQTQNILNFFLGYEKKDLFRLGVEYNMLTDAENKESHDINGISTYGTLTIKKIELLARYDQLASITLSGATDPWNNAKDYSMILGGIQFSPIKGVKTGLNYRHFTPRASGATAMDLIYVNFEFKF